MAGPSICLDIFYTALPCRKVTCMRYVCTRVAEHYRAVHLDDTAALLPYHVCVRVSVRACVRACECVSLARSLLRPLSLSLSLSLTHLSLTHTHTSLSLSLALSLYPHTHTHSHRQPHAHRLSLALLLCVFGTLLGGFFFFIFFSIGFRAGMPPITDIMLNSGCFLSNVAPCVATFTGCV